MAALTDLPHSVLHLVLEHLVLDRPAGGSGPTAAAVGSPRDAVHLAFTSKALLAAVACAEQLWQRCCVKLGFNLHWLLTLPPGTPAWSYFCRRMAVRHRLRRQLRSLPRFLDPLSAAAIRPALPLQGLLEVEAALQGPLPWELFELYRFCDGQDRERGGVQFLHEARLLSAREVLAAAQERQGPASLAKAFASLAVAPLAGSSEGGSSAAGDGGGSGGSSAAGNSGGSGGSSGAGGGGVCSASGAGGTGGGGESGAADEEPPEVLLPFSDELRGRRRYCMDLSGRVWLASGWHTHACAPSLSALLRRILT